MKIEKEYLLDHGHLDFSSFQVRLCTCDTALNKEGIDQVLFDTYKKGSVLTDLHTITSHSIFADKAKVPLYDVEDENGKHWIGDPDQKIKTKRGITTFKELKETDSIIDYIDE